MKLDDPDVVRREYATESGLAARKAAYANAAGPNAPDAVFEKIRAARPRRFLEVGCGQGELAERVQREPGAKVVAVDQSQRLVEPTRARGVDARLGDVHGRPAFGDHLGEPRNHRGAPVSTFRTFRGEDARPLLEHRFSAVEAVDRSRTGTFADRSAALAYAGPQATLSGVERDSPELDEPLVARRRPVIFVAIT